jgi:succinate dehydrogenase / fumarate reductase flavoprotein subunit
MGGILVSFEKDETTGGMKRVHPKNHATTIRGLYACGECDGAYHGANRLGANSLLSATFSGMVAGDASAAYIKGLKKQAAETAGIHFEAEQRRQEDINQRLLSSRGKENPFALHRELGDLMQEHVFVERDNKGLDLALEGIRRLKERSENMSLDDNGSWSNQSLSWARQIKDMIVLAEVIAQGARLRDECRGAHYKAEFELKIPEGKFEGDPEFEAYKAQWKANNEKWLKATIATHTDDGPEIDYRPVEASVLPPEKPRDYR